MPLVCCIFEHSDSVSEETISIPTDGIHCQLSLERTSVAGYFHGTQRRSIIGEDIDKIKVLFWPTKKHFDFVHIFANY